MYDPKFEKGVRQKMEGLQFSPSESVWANIEKAVASRRRRRSPFFFWRFALPGMLLAGAIGALYLMARPVSEPSSANASPAKPSPVNSSPAQLSPVMPSPGTSSAGTTAAREASPDVARANATVARSNATVARSNATVARSNAPVDRTNATPGRAAGTPHTVAPAGDMTSHAASSRPATSRPASPHRRTSDDPGNSRPATEHGVTASAPAQENASVPAPYLYHPGLAAPGGAFSVRAAKLSAKKTIAALSALPQVKRSWAAGFSAGAGISRLNKLNVSSADVSQSASSFYTINSAANASNKRYVSDVRPDASFMAGIYLQKPLSSRWTFNLGMNLHYYSTKITVGQPVITYVPVTASLIAPTVQPAAQATAAYIAGDKLVFTNRYYFVELPVGIQYKLNRSRMLPVFLEGGFSLSRLMGANALFYDTRSGVYYKDGSVLQKTQFNVSSALMIGLPFHGIHIEMGPQAQYGITPLINNPSLGDQHFLYTGIRVVVLPGKM